MMKCFEDSGSHLYTDNIYTFHVLYNHLYNRGINEYGKVRSNRWHFPSEMVTKATTHNRGSYNYISNGPLFVAV